MAAELQTRDGFGEFLNAQGLTDSAVELGAYRGEFARTVLSTWQGRQWYLVDPWDASPDFLLRHGGVPWDMITARRLCEVLAGQDPRARLVQVGNPAAEAAVPPLLDAVYIDACHDTRSVWQDLETWWPRVRPGGLLAGHDYLDAWRWHDDINRGVLFGVRTAVDTFARRIGRIVASTNEEFPTWWFRKPVGLPERVAVVSGSTADVPWREIALHNHERYCRLHGYEYRHTTLTNLQRPASWEKVRLVREALHAAEWVLWIDADALFQRPDMRLEHFWDGVSPFLWLKDQINGLNLGVFFARRCPETFEFLGHWEAMSERPEWRDHNWWENGAAMELERRGELPGLILPHRLANSYPHMPNAWQPGDFITHFAGLLPASRLMLIQDFAFRAELAFENVVHGSV